MVDKACVPVNVTIGSGHDFKGVASTLNPPADAKGALMDVAEVNQALIETIVEIDEGVLARYFDGQQPTAEETNRLIVQAVAQGNLIPIVCVASKQGGGLKELLETLAMCGLPPDKVVHKATNDAGAEVEVKADPAGPLVAQVWRTRIAM